MMEAARRVAASVSLVRIRVGVFVAFVVFAAPACGGGPGRLSAEEFERRANAACAQANREIETLLTVAVTDPMDAADSIDEIAGIQRQLRDELGTLRPPGDAQDTYDDWLESVDDGLAASDDLVDAMRTGAPGGQRQANEAGAAAVARADAAATALGAVECVAGDPPGAPTAPEEVENPLDD